MSTIRWVDPRDGVEVELVATFGCRGCRYINETCPQNRDEPSEAGPGCGQGSWHPVAAPATTAAPAMHRPDAPAPTVEQIMAAIDGCEASRDEIREMLTAALVAAPALAGAAAAGAAEHDGYRINADRTAAVALDTTWRADMDRCPRGVKVLLLVRDGCAVIGEYRGEAGFEAWHPLPKRATNGGVR